MCDNMCGHVVSVGLFVGEGDYAEERFHTR